MIQGKLRVPLLEASPSGAKARLIFGLYAALKRRSSTSLHASVGFLGKVDRLRGKKTWKRARRGLKPIDSCWSLRGAEAPLFHVTACVRGVLGKVDRLRGKKTWKRARRGLKPIDSVGLYAALKRAALPRHCMRRSFTLLHASVALLGKIDRLRGKKMGY